MVGPYYLQSLPEAQYQGECWYDLTTGTLAVLSEFGTADGRVDFYFHPKNGQLSSYATDNASNNTTLVFPPWVSMERLSTLLMTLCLT